MIMKVKEKEINLVIRTRKIISLTDKLKGKNLNEMFFKGQRECDLKTLATFIKEFAENEDTKASFSSLQEVYDFIDDYKIENNVSYEDIYIGLANEINDMGFFNKKMSKEELEKKLKDQLGDIDINQVFNKVVEKQVGEMTKEELAKESEDFKGFKA